MGENNSYTSTNKQSDLKNGQRTGIDISPMKILKWPTDISKDAQHH